MPCGSLPLRPGCGRGLVIISGGLFVGSRMVGCRSGGGVFASSSKGCGGSLVLVGMLFAKSATVLVVAQKYGTLFTQPMGKVNGSAISSSSSG